MTPPPPTGLLLDPALLVLRRPDDTVQLGWGPDTGAVLVPPAGLDAFDVCALLRMLDGRMDRDRILDEAGRRGLDPTAVATVVDGLVDAGMVRTSDLTGGDPLEPVTAPRLRVYGLGPLTEALCDQLSRTHADWSRAARYTDDAELRGGLGCVILADHQVPDPRLVRDLMAHDITHLTVRVRDGRGLVGPLVAPGRTSCLRCADLARTDADPAWPRLAAQLWRRIGHADRATTQVTAALALRQLDPILGGGRTSTPTAVDGTVEVDLRTYRFETRRWRPHPDCSCRTSRSGVQA
ncbi:MAG: TOMM precursor leader peptide-binding protein [Rhodococcus sp.]|mgnify:CR=1 FL=1|uniref:TOMM precursor leader peptide-binding protein n=1 Tax=Rhodococcus TaxID=1827 RepID=UPI0016BB4EE3|nr:MULTISPECIES: TOMM precursor leader peptide-binding protein [Rhodococcus]NLV81092.1 TOMM precursor leader peptide-binding protein [Rhodococcus sp. (in: high G+C Gram-positive bacteria)]